MVCVPCFLIPVLLFLWRIIQPYVLMLWNPPKVEGPDGKQQPDQDYCPSALMCPCAKKPTQNKTEESQVEQDCGEKKEN